MRGWFNDALRFVIARAVLLFGVLLELRQRLRIVRFTANQRRLRRKYRLHRDTPVLSYGPRVEESIRHATVQRDNTRFALTSGSTGQPKKILYTARRLHSLKFTFSDMFARACRAHGFKRTSLYVFSSFQTDASLTSMLLAEPKLPPYLSTLQAPYRVQQHPAVRALASQYGVAAVRLWVLTITNPSVLYATNPSTISTFFDELKCNWTASSRLVRDWHSDPHRFDRTAHKLAGRLRSSGSAERLRLVATSTVPTPLEQFAPAVRAYICWTGGYVKPFLDRLAIHLRPQRYRLVPMYSMSTETIETETVFRKREAYFLPLADGCVYEFIEASANDDNRNTLSPDQLQAGQTYAMVVSDRYGLRRYQTGDLFTCRGKINNLPDLTFLRRRDLEYSFIGEKVTAEQLTVVYEELRKQFPETLKTAFLTCIPSLPANENPHYKFVLVRDLSSYPGDLASICDQLLSNLNCEYKNKRANGALASPQFIQITAPEFAARFGSSWETQFKFLPLYQRTWESCSRSDAPHVNASNPLLSHKNTATHTQTTSLPGFA